MTTAYRSLSPEALRRLFLGLRADRGGLGLSVGKAARGNFFNSVHCFTLVCGVTC